MISLFVLFACGAEKSDVESDCPTYEGSFPVSNDSGVLSGTLYLPEDVKEGLFLEIGLKDEYSHYGSLPSPLTTSKTCGTEKGFYIEQAPSGTFSLIARVPSETQPAGEDAETVYDVQGSISITIDNDEHAGLEITLE